MLTTCQSKFDTITHMVYDAVCKVLRTCKFALEAFKKRDIWRLRAEKLVKNADIEVYRAVEVVDVDLC